MIVLILEDAQSAGQNRLFDVGEKCLAEPKVRNVLLCDGKGIAELKHSGTNVVHDFGVNLASPNDVGEWVAKFVKEKLAKRLLVVADLKFIGFDAISVEKEYGCEVYRALDSHVANADLPAVVYSRWVTGDNIDRLRTIFRTQVVLSRDNHNKRELMDEIEKLL